MTVVNAANQNAPKTVFSVVIVFALLSVFLALRIYYWSITNEEPFSDMADYLSISQKVLSDFDFSHDSFWRSYKPPTLALLGALVFGLTGSVNILAWRIFESLLLFAGAYWCAAELFKLVKKPWLMYLFLTVVVFSRCSIFWSYKFSTESMAEALCYWVAAYGLYTLRKPRLLHCFLLGALVTVAILNRPQFLPVLPLYVLMFFLRRSNDGTAIPFKVRVGVSLCVMLGALTCWAPWIVRNYKIYSAFVPLSTQGPYSFLWELGDLTMTVDNGEVLHEDRFSLQVKAREQFKNDYEASRYAGKFSVAWLSQHWAEYPGIVHRRFWNSIESPEVELTKVSRQDLFPGNWDSYALIDKSFVFMLLGIIGLLALPFVANASASIIAVVALGPWLFGLLFLGSARILEPSLPLIFFGNCAWLLLAERSLVFFSRGRGTHQPSAQVTSA